MSFARTSIKGMVFCNTKRAYNGFTLFAPVDGTGVWLIDLNGRFVNYWEMGYKPGGYGELLPNGHLLYVGKLGDSALDLEGAAGILLEADWDGKVVWEYRDPYLHDACYRMRNGNTLVVKWVPVPNEIAVKVKGGNRGTERRGVMWGDAILEITPEGRVVWEWIAHEHLDPVADNRCPLCPRNEWLHADACVELPDGNILTCFMKSNSVAIIDKETGDIKWQWGTNDLAHPHSPTMLDNGNILLFDNGIHLCGITMGNSRVLEVDPDSNEIVWSYKEDLDLVFYSSIMGNCQRLPNANTLVCESTTGRLFEITPQGEVVWEFVNNLPAYELSPIRSSHCMVYYAYRYGLDYSGLRRALPLPAERQSAPGTAKPAEVKKKEEKAEEAFLARVHDLGY